MYYTIKYSIIISKIVNLIYEIELLCKDEKIDECTVDLKLSKLSDMIYDSGCIGIKFTQWYISKLKKKETIYNKRIINYFTDIFDNCPQHSTKYTYELFKNDFGVDISDVIQVKTLKVLASGSIGQVYYAKLKDGKEVAIKVKHPNIDEEVAQFENFMNGLSTIQKIPSLKKKYKLYFNFDEFMRHIKQQINMEIEVFNILRFRKNYEDNKCIIFPKIHYYSHNIIIMEYINGEKFETLSEYQKMKMSLNILCFIQHSFLIDDFVHQDLHDGNWCVKKLNDGSYGLVIFDCGLCVQSGDIIKNRLLWDTFESIDKESMINLIKENVKEGYINDEIYNDISNIIDNFTKKQHKIGDVLNSIMDYIVENTDIIMDNIILNTIIVTNTIEHVLEKYIYLQEREESYYDNEDVKKTIEKCGGTNVIGTHIMNQNIISYCKSKNIYLKLKDYLENLDNENKVKQHNEELFFCENSTKFLDIEPPE